MYLFIFLIVTVTESKYTTEVFGFFGVASVSPEVEIGNPKANVENILKELNNEALSDSHFIVFPELSISGYTCGDLFFQQNLLEDSANALLRLSTKLKDDPRTVVVGAPLLFNGKLYNCAVLISAGKLIGVVPKIHIPNYQEFYEKRWFFSGRDIYNEIIRIGDQDIPFGSNLIFNIDGIKIGIEICEDLWVPSPPSSSLCSEGGAEIICNLSATDDNIGKYNYIKSLVASQSGRCRCCYVYASAGKGESSSDLVFSGINIIACDGKIVSSSKRFSSSDSLCTATIDVEKLRQDRKKYSTFYSALKQNIYKEVASAQKNSSKSLMPEISVDTTPFIPGSKWERNESCAEIIQIQTWGLSQRLHATGCRNLIVGVSGGLDSTLALLIAHNTFLNMGIPPENITGVSMPAEATSERTYSNARTLMDCLGVTYLEIPIGPAVSLHFKDINHDPQVFDSVYENSQARERTQVLMDLANKCNGMVLGTGDMSELALGWCTYNGDHMSMYNVNGGVPKTLVKYLVSWFADNSSDPRLRYVLQDIASTPISPELIPADSKKEIAQKTEDIVGPYELHDFFLFHMLRNGFSPTKILFLATQGFKDTYPRSVIKKWLLLFYKRFFSQQFKRSCLPDGPKIGSVCLSPRGDWRMPSDASAKLWLDELNRI